MGGARPDALRRLVWALAALVLIEGAALTYVLLSPPGGRDVSAADAAPPVPDLGEQVRRTLRENPQAIAPLVPREPVLGGSWGAYSLGVQAIPPRYAAIAYDDGHIGGVLVVQVDDPRRPETWRRLYDDPDGSLPPDNDESSGDGASRSGPSGGR